MYTVIKTLDELKPLKYNEPIFCDIESEGLYIRPRLIQFYQEHLDKVLIVDLDELPLEDTLERMKEV